MSGLNPAIVSDIKRVAREMRQTTLSRGDYLQRGRFTEYQIYDGGQTWEGYCKAAGVVTRKKEPVPDEIYFTRLAKAVEDLGRFPKVSERKKFGLNFSKRRYPTLKSFIQKAIQLEKVILPVEPTDTATRPRDEGPTPGMAYTEAKAPVESARPVPPIPVETRRKKWERTGIDGFPYAPQDESGVVALFGILCSKRIIDWQILELRGGKGIDATCHDHVMNREVRVEIKHTLSRGSWQHRIEDVDYVICWENRWPDFPKPVIVLRDILPKNKYKS